MFQKHELKSSVSVASDFNESRNTNIQTSTFSYQSGSEAAALARFFRSSIVANVYMIPNDSVRIRNAPVIEEGHTSDFQ